MENKKTKPLTRPPTAPAGAMSDQSESEGLGLPWKASTLLGRHLLVQMVIQPFLQDHLVPRGHPLNTAKPQFLDALGHSRLD